MMRIRPQQHGQECSGVFSSSGVAVAALMASIGKSGTASKARMRAAGCRNRHFFALGWAQSPSLLTGVPTSRHKVHR